MGDSGEVLYEYRGSRFILERQAGWYTTKSWYAVTGIVNGAARLELPEFYQGSPVTHWKAGAGKHGAGLSGVESLYIPRGITCIAIDNGLLPGLKKVEVQQGHGDFSTDGKMLYTEDGEVLLYSFAEGNQEEAVVPGKVKKIADGAFRHSRCQRIRFENQDVTAARDAFAESEWIEQDRAYVLVGNMFFRLNYAMEKLVVPQGIRRFHESAFDKAVPRHLVTSIMPSRGILDKLGGRGSGWGCLEVTLSSTRMRVDFEAVRRIEGLQALHVAEGHKKYKSQDGVVFSRDGRCLLYYPAGRQEKNYAIPEGVVKLAQWAFCGQGYLKGVFMPESVKAVGTGAFYQCRALDRVRLSRGLREIPDACAYQGTGVFEQCVSLKEIALPEKLRYLGSYAFCGSGLREIVLNEGLRQVGEYAFLAENFQEVVLPSSLERLGRGALYYVQRVEACIGTAKGLVSAVNAVHPFCTEKRGKMEWGRCMVRARYRRGERTELFLIPGSLRRSAACHLEMAWNGGGIDYEEYDACFREITDPEERLEFARQGILRLKGEEDTPYTTYMKHSALKIASSLVEGRKEEEFLAFLEERYLSEAALAKLLKMTNKAGLTTYSAYILKYQNEKRPRDTKAGKGIPGQRKLVL